MDDNELDIPEPKEKLSWTCITYENWIEETYEIVEDVWTKIDNIP